MKKLGEYFPSPYYNWRTYDDTLIIENEFGLKTKKIVHHKGLDFYIDTLLVYMKHDTSLVIKELNKLLAKISQIKLEERKDYYIQFIKEHHPDFVAYKEALSNLLDSFKGDDRETARKTLEKLVVEGKNLRELTRVFHTIRSIIREVPEKERLTVLHFCLEDWKTTGRIGYTNDVEIDGRIYLIRTLCISPCIWNPSPEGLYSYTLSGVKGLKHSILEFVHDNRFTSRSRNYQLKLLEEIYDMLKELPPEQRKIAFNTFYSLWKTKYDSLRHLNELSERRYEERLQEVIAQTQKLSSSIRSFNRKKWEIAKFFITKVVPISFIIIILLSLYIVIYAIERNTRTVQELRNALEKLNTSIQGNEKEKNSENNTQ